MKEPNVAHGSITAAERARPGIQRCANTPTMRTTLHAGVTYCVENQHEVTCAMVAADGAEVAVTRLTECLARVAHLRTAQHSAAQIRSVARTATLNMCFLPLTLRSAQKTS